MLHLLLYQHTNRRRNILRKIKFFFEFFGSFLIQKWKWIKQNEASNRCKKLCNLQKWMAWFFGFKAKDSCTQFFLSFHPIPLFNSSLKKKSPKFLKIKLTQPNKVALNQPQYGSIGLYCGMCIKIVGTGSGSGANPISEIDAFISGKKKKTKKTKKKIQKKIIFRRFLPWMFKWWYWYCKDWWWEIWNQMDSVKKKKK